MNLYLWFGLMVIISSIWLVWFLYRPLKNNMFNLEKSNISLGKQKQAELERDLQQNLIDEAVFKQAKDEITQTLAIELNQTSVISVNNQQPVSFWLTGLMVVFLSIASLGTYQFLMPEDAPVTQVDQPTQPPSLEQSAVELKQYLEKNKEDFEAWKTLGLVLFELDDIKGSLAAYEHSYQLNSNNVSMLVEYASAIATAQNDQFTGRASTLVREALEINPNAPDALYLAGLVAANAQQFDLARQIWQRSLSLLPQDHSDRLVLESILAELAQIQGEPIPEYQVVINATLSERLRQTEFENHYLMIYIKAAQGRPMPIAIQKIRVKDFKGTITLTDSDSVMPTRKLSQSDKVVAVVRLSQSGAAMKQPGDIQILSQVVHVRDNPTVNLQVE